MRGGGGGGVLWRRNRILRDAADRGERMVPMRWVLAQLPRASVVRRKFRQDVGVRPHRVSSVGRGNRLEHLDPSQAADEHAMRASGEDRPHYDVCGF